jgi:hypothetical protein
MDHPDYDGYKRRWADFYIVCLLKHEDQNTIKPHDLDQWTFCVIETKQLDNFRPNQKSIGLDSLMELNPTKCNYDELLITIDG